MTDLSAVEGSASVLRIDLDALRANYRLLRDRVAPAECAAVVKANSYGLGAREVATALLGEGCRTFFVARLSEAEALKGTLCDDSRIFILNGLAPGSEARCAALGALPVLNSHSQIANWRALAKAKGRALPAALQIDSGMSRLGLSPEDAIALAADETLHADIDLHLIMTHLACADAPERSVSDAQLANFQAVRAHFPDVPGSIANSGGIFLSPAFRCEVARPGVALYGVALVEDAAAIRPVVRLDVRVAQIRTVPAGTGVGYGLTFVPDSPRRLATIGIGYADGWPRHLSSVGAAYYKGVRLPIAGRVSMDSITLDISDPAADTLAEGDFVELIGPSQSLDDVARDAGTIAYEILTRLGQRHTRIFTCERPTVLKYEG